MTSTRHVQSAILALLRGHQTEVTVTTLLDRNRLYALIGSLEDDLRDLIRTYLLDGASEQDILGPAYDDAAERFIQDPNAWGVGADLMDYLHLGDEIAI